MIDDCHSGDRELPTTSVKAAWPITPPRTGEALALGGYGDLDEVSARG
jgi:hypothetical protein